MKHINRVIILPLFLLMICLTCLADGGRQAGIFASYADFTNSRLIYTLDPANAKDHISADGVFVYKKFSVVTAGQKHVLLKKDVYGFAGTDGKNYRFYKDESYQIVDTAGFFLYYRYKPLQGGKDNAALTAMPYFFSVTGDGDLLPLTKENLERCFAGNKKFRYGMDGLFRSDKELAAFDRLSGEYKIKHIYLASL